MKIAHLVCTFPPYKGGMGNVAFQQAKELVRLGHQVTVFVPQREKSESSSEKKGISVKKIKPWLKAGQGAFLPQFFWLLRDFDIIHLHYPFFGGAEVVWFARLIKFLKVPLVFHHHMDVTNPKAGFFKYLLPFNKFILPSELKLANKIIASSKDYALHSQIKNYIKKHPEKFQEIPFGVDQKRFFPIPGHHHGVKADQGEAEAIRSRPVAARVTESYNKSADKTILFVGGLDQAHYFKGINYLLNALSCIENFGLQAKKLKSYKLIIVGDGDLRSHYEKIAQDLGIQDRVIFAGKVSDEDLPKYYNLADLFVLPSIDQSEAFGLVLLEAMACAKPCIASNLPGVRTVVDDNRTGCLFEPRNINDLAEKIIRLLSDEKLNKTFGQAGLEKVRKIYNWQTVGRDLEDLYKKLVPMKA